MPEAKMQARNQLLISEIVKNKEIITLLWKKYNREFDTSKLKRIPQSLETGLFFVKFLFLLYSNIW